MTLKGSQEGRNNVYRRWDGQKTAENFKENFAHWTTLPWLMMHTKDEVIILGLQLSITISVVYKVNTYDSQKQTLCKMHPN